MANTLYFPDGTHEVLFNSDPTEEFARIIDERLGKDCLEVFEQIVEKNNCVLALAKDEIEAADERIKDLYRTIISINYECNFLDFGLSQTRVDRKECQKAVNKIRKVIGEVL